MRLRVCMYVFVDYFYVYTYIYPQISGGSSIFFATTRSLRPQQDPIPETKASIHRTHRMHAYDSYYEREYSDVSLYVRNYFHILATLQLSMYAFSPGSFVFVRLIRLDTVRRSIPTRRT